MKFIPVPIGTKFGRWTVIGEAVQGVHGHEVPCRCECGTEKLVAKASLRAGKSLSCGCLCRERTSAANTTHGMSRCRPEHHRVYDIWTAMLRRCYNPNVKRFHNHGGRGITVCDRWKSFENFLEDMGLPPSDAHTLERIDNFDEYAPDNCKWATQKEQANNRRDNINITYQGRTQTLMQWSEELGINYTTLKQRYHKGWSGAQLFGKVRGS